MIPMPDWLKVIQLKPRFLFGIWLIGSLILFLPNGFADEFGIKAIRENYRGWIGIGTLAAFAFWLVQLIPAFQNWRAVKKIREEIIHSVDSLSPEERRLLAFCLWRNQQTITLEITHRAAGALVAKGMLIQANVTGDILAWPFTVPDFLWHHLKADHQLILQGTDPNDPQLLENFRRMEAHIRRWDHLG
jgi:hypothetical protein